MNYDKRSINFLSGLFMNLKKKKGFLSRNSKKKKKNIIENLKVREGRPFRLQLVQYNSLI